VAADDEVTMRFLSLTFLGLLAACATAVGTSYQPADSKGYGYSEQRVEGDRYRVTFRGDGATPAEAVEDFALRRAAELARANGYDWFRLVGRSVDEEEKGGVGIGAGVGTGSYGRRSGVSVGAGGNLGTIGAKRFYTARIEVLMGKGPVPEGPDYYDAGSVLSSVEGRGE
jgi:hypothetical protein